MKNNDIAYLTANEAIQRMKTGQITAEKLVKTACQFAKNAQKLSNCLTETFYRQAIKQAKIADILYQQGKARSLEGIPILVKEEALVKGTKTTYCSKIHKNHKASHNDIHIQRLFDAGAIMIAKTTTPEFCLLGTTLSDLYGITTNPWNHDYSPGGSSGGTAAGLALGGGIIGTGSDIGGSIRIPSAASGIVGFKPPIGRIPESSIMAFDYYSHVGPMARSVKDIAIMMNVMAGQHPNDITSLRDKPVHTIDNIPNNLQGVTIGYNIDLGHFNVHPDVIKNTKKFIKKCADLGAKIVHLKKLTIPKDLVFFAEAHVALISGNYTAAYSKTNPQEITQYAKIFAQFQESLEKMDMMRADEIAFEFSQTFAREMQQCDLFVCPTNAQPSDKADGYPTLIPLDIDGRTRMGLDCYWYMTIPFNMLSRCPVLSIPTGFAKNKVPTSVQIVGKPFMDESVLTAGMVIENHYEWYKNKINRPPLKNEPSLGLK